jgi:hypothetical protein
MKETDLKNQTQEANIKIDREYIRQVYKLISYSFRRKHFKLESSDII